MSTNNFVAASLCSNPDQCTAFHELSAHMSEMNTKLTSLLSLMQMFFHSYRTDNKKQQKTQEDILQKVSESQTHLQLMKRRQQSTNLTPAEPKSQNYYQSAMAAAAAIMQMQTAPVAGESTDWSISPEALPVEKNGVDGSKRSRLTTGSKSPDSGLIPTPPASLGTNSVIFGTEKSSEELEIVEPTAIKLERDINEENMAEEGDESCGFNNSMDHQNGNGGSFVKEMSATRGESASPKSAEGGSFPVIGPWGSQSSSRCRFRMNTRTFPETVTELRRHILLFPGSVVTPRALSRVGSLAYFRKKKMIAYDVLKVNVDALREEGILSQDGYRLPHFKVPPPNLTEKHRALLKKYRVTDLEYAEAFNSPPYNLSEKRKPDDFSTVTMVRDWSSYPKVDFEPKSDLSPTGAILSARFLDSLGLDMSSIPGMPGPLSPNSEDGKSTVQPNLLHNKLGANRHTLEEPKPNGSV